MRPYAKSLARRSLFAALALAASGSVWAQSTDQSSTQSYSPALDRFSLYLGAYYTDNTTNISGQTNKFGGVSGNLNLQNDLDFPKHTWQPRVRFDFLIGDHSGLDFDFYHVDQSHSKTEAASAVVDGTPVSGQATVGGYVNFDFAKVGYKWWFGTGSDVFGVGVAAAYYRVHAGIEGSGTATATGIGTVSGATGASYTDSAWAPDLELGWRHAFNNNLRVYANIDGIKRWSGSPYGDIYNGSVGVEWFPFQSWGVGAEYDYSRININWKHTSYNDRLYVRTDGPTFFIRYRFD